MHRFFAPPQQIQNNEVVLGESEARHIATVLRLKAGDTIQVLDGEGRAYIVELSHVDKKTVDGKVLETQVVDVESPLRIHLGQSLIKGKRLDDLIRKTFELGVHKVTLLNTARTVVRVKDPRDRTERWQKIGQEAAKQCGRNRVPEIKTRVLDLDSFLKDASSCDLKIMFWEEENSQKLSDIAKEMNIKSVSLLMGPEGGFTQEEAELAKEYGYHTLSLGPRILRADTATIAALSLTQHLWGDL